MSEPEERTRIDRLYRAKRRRASPRARGPRSKQDDGAWERRIAYPQVWPRLDAFLRDEAAERDSPLNPNDL
jgi:hypothetical protein